METVEYLMVGKQAELRIVVCIALVKRLVHTLEREV